MKTKNILVTIIIALIVNLSLFFYITYENRAFGESGIVEIKTNLQNYKVIPKDKGGIQMPCLEILECEKE